jgi:hypothetical protein
MRDVEELDLRVERLEHFLEAVHKDSVERDDELAKGLAELAQVVRALQSAQLPKQVRA